MAIDENNYHPLKLRRGETRTIPFTYRPIDKSLPPYDLTNGVVEMKIQPAGAAEIVFGSPQIQITDAAAGKIAIAIPGATITAFEFQTAPYAVLLNGKRLFYGDLTIKSLYE